MGNDLRVARHAVQENCLHLFGGCGACGAGLHTCTYVGKSVCIYVEEAYLCIYIYEGMYICTYCLAAWHKKPSYSEQYC